MSVRLNPVLAGLGTYPFVRLEQARARLRAAGVDIIDFGMGEPREETPAFIREALASAITPGAKITAAFNWTPFVGGTAILVSWIITAILLRVKPSQIREIFAKTWSQMWGACLVGVFIFGLAYIYNYSGMAGSLASAFSIRSGRSPGTKRSERSLIGENPPLQGEGDREAVEGYQRKSIAGEADTPPPRRCAPRSPSPQRGGS